MKTHKSKLFFFKGSEFHDTDWNQQIEFISQDENLNDRFESYVFPDNVFMENNNLVDNLKEKVEFLDNWLFETLDLKNPKNLETNHKIQYFNQIVFVGVGTGGLLIFSFIKKLLEDQNRFDQFFRCLRQVILFDTPLTKKFEIEAYLQKIYPHINIRNSDPFLFSNLNKEIKKLYDFIDLNVINAKEFKNNQWPIPMIWFKSKNDKTQQGNPNWFPKDAIKIINKDHLGMISPIPINSERFLFLKKYLLDPIGHKNVFEIDEFVYSLSVEPFEQGEKPIPKFRGKEVIKTVNCENKGVVSRTMVFSQTNICHDLFEIKYGTTNIKGGIIPSIRPVDYFISNDTIEEYNRNAMIFKFRFNPFNDSNNKRGYNFSVEVYKGFDGVSGQNAHFHLEKGKRYYNIKRIKLDLEKFNNNQYKMVAEPKLYLMDEDTHNCAETAESRVSGNNIEPERSDKNNYVWEWNLYDIRSGVLDIIWEIQPTHEEKGIENKPRRTLIGKQLILKENRIEQEQFAVLLLNCSSISNRNRFINVINELNSKEINDNLDHSGKPILLVTDLIEESLRFNKFSELISILEEMENGSDAFKEVQKYLE